MCAVKSKDNKLCSTCTKLCKQAHNVIVANCGSYVKAEVKFTWKQLEFKFNHKPQQRSANKGSRS